MCTNLNEVHDKYTQYNIKDKKKFKKIKVKNFTCQEIIKMDKLYNLKEKRISYNYIDKDIDNCYL